MRNQLLLERVERLEKMSLYPQDVLLDNWHVCVDPPSTPPFDTNNCFTLGTRMKKPDGGFIKVPVSASPLGIQRLTGGVDGKLGDLYRMSYTWALQRFYEYQVKWRKGGGDDSLRVCLYLDGAMYGDLYYFVIDFDRFDEESPFFKAAKALAGKVTRSQGGGYHMFFGINKALATPLFDSINLLTSCNAQSYVHATGKVTLDGKNKVDFFCDARQLIYEWEPWDDILILTDKTVELYELIRDNFSLQRPQKARKPEAKEALWEKLMVLGCQTGYPPNLLLEAWEDEWSEDQDWDAFRQTVLELDL